MEGTVEKIIYVRHRAYSEKFQQMCVIGVPEEKRKMQQENTWED
jgi:hypothetical protein